MSKVVFVLFVIFTSNCNLICAISSKENSFSVRQIGQSLIQCLGGSEIINCFENKISKTLDKAIANNETWQLSEFFTIEKNTNTNSEERLSNTNNFDKLHNLTKERSEQDPLRGTLALKMLQLARERSLRLQLPPTSVRKLLYERSNNSASGDFHAASSDVQTEAAVATVQQSEQEEGRKRKHKNKNMAMFGGMAMLAVIAQMFLGKVILIAGAAFVMAKIALLISALGSLKSGTANSWAGKDHVIVTGGAREDHSHEHISSWHRRSPYESKKFEVASLAEQKFTDPVSNYEAAEKGKFLLRNEHPRQPIKNNLNKVYL